MCLVPFIKKHSCYSCLNKYIQIGISLHWNSTLLKGEKHYSILVHILLQIFMKRYWLFKVVALEPSMEYLPCITLGWVAMLVCNRSQVAP